LAAVGHNNITKQVMEKQESKSKWDDLASELGVEISSEIQQREEAVSQASQEIVSQPRETPAESHAPLPKRIAPGWDSLATDFGLPTPEPVESPTPLATEPSRTEASREERHPEPRARERESAPASREDRHERERRPRREQSERGRDDRGGRGGHRGQRGRRDQREQRGERDHRDKRREHRSEDEEILREREPDVPTTREVQAPRVEAAPPREQSQKPAAVSLWHKIFGAPAEQAPKATEDVVAEPAAPSDVRDEPRAEGSGFADAHAGEPIESRFDDDEFLEGAPNRGEDSLTRDEERPSEHRGGRSRRRRGRGRGRKPDDRQPEGRSTSRRDDRPRPERSRPEIEDEFADDEFGADDDVDDALGDDDAEGDEANGVATGATSPRGTSALQRAIPSWDEAIGFIVDSNMQSRSQRRPPSRPGSRDNSSRGRSRGRRKS
jgi:hypothetical protein